MIFMIMIELSRAVLLLAILCLKKLELVIESRILRKLKRNPFGGNHEKELKNQKPEKGYNSKEVTFDS